MSWDVEGAASLAYAKGTPEAIKPSDWTEQAVASTGTQQFAPKETTTYRVVALDAHPGADASFAMQPVTVPSGPMDKGNTATCDAANLCSSSFTVDASAAVMVRQLSTPRLTHSGKSRPIKIGVTKGDGPALWVEPGATVDVDLAAAGTWTLQAQLPADVQPTPPPMLRLHLGFGCP